MSRCPGAFVGSQRAYVVLDRPVNGKMRRRPPPARQVRLPDLRAGKSEAAVNRARVVPPHAPKVRVVVREGWIHDRPDDIGRLWHDVLSRQHHTVMSPATRHALLRPCKGTTALARDSLTKMTNGVAISKAVRIVGRPCRKGSRIGAWVAPCRPLAVDLADPALFLCLQEHEVRRAHTVESPAELAPQ